LTKVVPSEQGPSRGIRRRIADDLEAVYEERVSSFFTEALEATKDVWATCTHCNRKTPVQTPDWNARTRALQLMIEQGYGRPKTEAAEDSNVTIILERIWPPMEELPGAA
jgi:hypothetical protein